MATKRETETAMTGQGQGQGQGQEPDRDWNEWGNDIERRLAAVEQQVADYDEANAEAGMEPVRASDEARRIDDRMVAVEEKATNEAKQIDERLKKIETFAADYQRLIEQGFVTRPQLTAAVEQLMQQIAHPNESQKGVPRTEVDRMIRNAIEREKQPFGA